MRKGFGVASSSPREAIVGVEARKKFRHFHPNLHTTKKSSSLIRNGFASDVIN